MITSKSEGELLGNQAKKIALVKIIFKRIANCARPPTGGLMAQSLSNICKNFLQQQTFNILF